MTEYLWLDIILVIIFIAATVWYVKSLIDELKYIMKKSLYYLCIYNEDKGKFEVISVYTERKMRNAVANHITTYRIDLKYLHYQPFVDYNEYAMHYSLFLGEHETHFTMLHESVADGEIFG